MLEPTIRGNLDAVLDPDNPSVNKQTMLDWLRINHPKTVVRSKANKDEVANIVRGVQPHIFHNSASNASANTSASPDTYPALEHLQVTSPVVIKSFKTNAHLTKGVAFQHSEGPDSLNKPVIDKVGSNIKHIKVQAEENKTGAVSDERQSLKVDKTSSYKSSNLPSKVADPYPKLESPRLSSPIKEQLAKRSASQDLEVPYPKKRLGISETGANRIKAKMEAQATSDASRSQMKKAKPSKTKTARPAKPAVSKWLHGMPAPSAPVSTLSSVSNEDDRRELETLKKSIHTPPHDASNDLTSPTAASVLPEANPATNHNDNVDLIEFSDTEIFEVGNLVFGRDIPTINMQADPSKSKTGVDVFQEEQRREEKVRSLEERLAHLESSLAIAEQKASNSLFQDLQQEQVNAAAIDQHSSLLQQAQEDIAALQSRLEAMDAYATDLQHDLDSAHINIKAHEKVLRKILGPHSNIKIEESYDSETETEDDESQETSESCDNDSPLSE